MSGWVSEYVQYGWLRAGMRWAGWYTFLWFFACVCAWSECKACGFWEKSGGWVAFPKHSFRSNAGWNGNGKMEVKYKPDKIITASLEKSKKLKLPDTRRQQPTTTT